MLEPDAIGITVDQTATNAPDAPLFTDLCRRIELALDLPLVSKESTNDATAGLPGSALQASTTSDAAKPFEAPWIGTDEAGKGDYFGPLVSAAVYVDERILERLGTLGVRDSKLLSDRKVQELAKHVRAACRGYFAEVEVPPEKYNRLYADFRKEGKTLNTLL